MFFKRDKEIEELEYRILILEKRLEEYRRENKRLTEYLYNANHKAIMELRETKANKRVRKTK